MTEENRAKRNEYMSAYRENLERLREANRCHRAKDPEAHRQYMREYMRRYRARKRAEPSGEFVLKERERARKYYRELKEERRERIRANAKAYYLRHRDEILAKRKEPEEREKEKIRRLKRQMRSKEE